MGSECGKHGPWIGPPCHRVLFGCCPKSHLLIFHTPVQAPAQCYYEAGPGALSPVFLTQGGRGSSTTPCSWHGFRTCKNETMTDHVGIGLGCNFGVQVSPNEAKKLALERARAWFVSQISKNGLCYGLIIHYVFMYKHFLKSSPFHHSFWRLPC